MMKRRIDWSLYLVTDRPLCLGRPLEQVINEAVLGGVTAVQIREKAASKEEFVELARKVQDFLRGRGVPLIINDRVDVALAVGADGVHLGQSDTPYVEAREVMGPDAVIGLSVETPGQALEAENFDVDYLGVGPVYPTSTKSDAAPAWGTANLRDLRARSRHTLVAIGGLNRANAGEVIRAGADGIAVVSAICSAESPEEASRELREIIDRAKAESRAS